jgi:hypothetical protein
MLFLVVRMGYRAATRDDDGVTSSILLARAALSVVFITISIAMAFRWHQPLNPIVLPGLIVAIFLVWFAPDL